jgi:hypothetical protein
MDAKNREYRTLVFIRVYLRPFAVKTLFGCGASRAKSSVVNSKTPLKNSLTAAPAPALFIPLL